MPHLDWDSDPGWMASEQLLYRVGGGTHKLWNSLGMSSWLLVHSSSYLPRLLFLRNVIMSLLFMSKWRNYCRLVFLLLLRIDDLCNDDTKKTIELLEREKRPNSRLVFAFNQFSAHHHQHHRFTAPMKATTLPHKLSLS